MKIDDYLNPKSMMTPGIAGIVLMIISNTLWLEFGLPKKYTALFLSLLIVILVMAKYSAPLYEKAIYFVLNWLIIFSLTINSNYGVKLAAQTASGIPFAAVSSMGGVSAVNYQDSAVKPPSVVKSSHEGGMAVKPQDNKRRFFDPYF